MKIINFANRNFKEIIRDPLSVIFTLALPLFLLFIFQQFEIPNESYNIENFTPGIVIFSFSFISMFTAILIAKDRSTSFLVRLGTGPMKPYEYILGYTIALLPIVLVQNVLFYSVALILGLKFTFNIILSILTSLLISILFIAIGIILGCITSDKAAAGVSSIMVQLVAFTSGMYFSTDMIGEGFKVVCNILPFSNCLDVIKGILHGEYSNLLVSTLIILAYTIVSIVLANILFCKKMKQK